LTTIRNASHHAGVHDCTSSSEPLLASSLRPTVVLSITIALPPMLNPRAATFQDSSLPAQSLLCIVKHLTLHSRIGYASSAYILATNYPPHLAQLPAVLAQLTAPRPPHPDLPVSGGSAPQVPALTCRYRAVVHVLGHACCGALWQSYIIGRVCVTCLCSANHLTSTTFTTLRPTTPPRPIRFSGRS